MKQLILAIGAAALCSAGAAAEIRTPAAITGCVRAGTEPDTFVLLDVKDITDGKPAPVGVVYWLSSTRDVKNHVGQKVEVRGTYSVDRDYGKTATVKIKTDPEKGEQTIALENGAKKTETKEELRPVGTSGVLPRDVEVKKVYRRLEVGSVRTIAASCDVP